jgi:putative membrane protein
MIFNGVELGLFGLRLLMMLILWIGLILLAIWLVRSLFKENSVKRKPNRPLTAREILDRRYSRGEITRQQYELMKKDISNHAD